MAHSTTPTMIGRDAELTEISSVLGIAADDISGSVLLAGDAGVGKTRMLITLRDQALADGWTVLAGHCLDFGESALPYLPFSEVMGRLATANPELVDQVVTTHPSLGRLLPGRRTLAAAEGESHATERGQLFEAMHHLLESAAPVLLVIEDLHWADQSTRDLLGFLFTRPFTNRVALIGSYRSDDLHRRHPLRRQLAEWSRLRELTRVELAPLPEASVRQLVAELSAEPIDPTEVSDIVDRADGNAFFVEELVASGGGRWLPGSLADVLLVRLDHLDDNARQVVRIASVAGRRVSHQQLEAAAGLTPDDLEAACRQAVERNVLVARDGDYAFRHALLAEAVYDDLLPGERVRLHQRYAAALADASARGTAAELARHARKAHDLDTALTAGIRAGQEALAVGGPSEAAQHFEQALELADPERTARLDVDLSRLALNASEALWSSGDTHRAAAVLREQLDRLPEDAPPTWRPRMLSSYARALSIIETTEDPVALAAEAVRLSPEGDSGLRAKTLAMHAHLLLAWGRFEEANKVGLEALALAERLDLPLLSADIMTTLGGLKKSGPRDDLRAALAEAVGQAARNGAVESELRGRFLIGRSYQDAAEWDGAVEWFASAMALGERSGLVWAPFSLEARWQLAWVRYVQGRWDDVLALTDVINEAGAPVVPRAMLESVRLYVLLGRGDSVKTALAGVRQTWELDGAIAIHAAGVAIDAAVARADVAAAFAAYDDAVEVLGRLWRPWFGARIRFAALSIAVAAKALPDVSGAERPAVVARVDALYADGARVLAEYEDPSGSWGAEGRAWHKRLDAETLRVRWLAGVDAPPKETLLTAWAECEQLFAELGHVPELTRVRVVLSGIHRAVGDAAEARRLGDLARAVAHELGAQPLLDELRASGSAPVKGGPGARVDLTARETEILRLVAEGRSNGEIGKLLFISAKTVSVHVSNILGKLGAAGRTEAAAVARRRGLLD